jgi:lysozyme
MIRPAVVTLLAAALLAGCGGPRSHSRAAIQPARGIPKGFGDARPHDWRGPSPNQLQVQGIDASRYQGTIDWAAAKRAGVTFAMLKATEGGDVADSAYLENAAAARRAGIRVGAYHFYYFCTPPAQQAAWFIAHVPAHTGDLPPILDIEWNHASRTCNREPDGPEVRAEVQTFLDILTRHYGQRPVIYTTPDFWRQTQLAALGNEDFWLRSVAGHPSQTLPGARWTFWQYTGTGQVPGVRGPVDLNAFAGSQYAWASWLSTRAL